MNQNLPPPLTPEEEQELEHLINTIRLNKGTNGISADDIQAGGSHYKDMGVQPWTVMEALLTRDEFVGFHKGNITKNSLRAGRKDGTDDAGKAKHSLQKLTEFRGY